MDGISRQCRRKLIPILILLVVCLLTGCISTSNQVDSKPTEEPFYAWDFALESLDGTLYTLSAMRGQWVLVNFWATWCTPCLEEMPVLQSIHDNFDNVIVLGINQRENPDVIQSFLVELDITFPILINPTDRMLMDYAVVGLPQSILVDPDGVIVWRQFGTIDMDIIEQDISTLITTRPVDR